ncbi:MAG: alanine--glyoxylate aminotransferase family protein [Ignavibacteria bacterium]|nr:alanine--glyoxylate aminotransferase family protein [Ignavibacteria bacterium]
MFKRRLFTPGPTPVPEKIMLKMSEPIIHHRNPEFKEIFAELNSNIKYLFQTKQNVYTLTSSGTGAMEAAVGNVISDGDKAIFVNGGKFGERWGQMIKTFGGIPIEVKKEWGKPPSVDEIIDLVKKDPDVKAIYLTHSETSSGTVTNVREIAKAVHEISDALIVVDGITSVGAIELKMDEWDLDIVLTGSQKGLMIPPGLSFIAVSERAWRKINETENRVFYFSLKKAQKALESGDTPWTPAITLVIGANEALKLIKEEGLENIWKRHHRLAEGIRIGVKALGLKLMSKNPSNAITAVFIPEGIEFKKFNDALKYEFGITVAGGQEQYKGKLFRISHLGYYDELDMITMISALEFALKKAGYNFQAASGVNAIQNYFLMNL